MMINPKLVELYAVLFILCTAVMFFGLFQMQSALWAVMNQVQISPMMSILYGVMVSAFGLVVTTLIIFVFFRKIQKSRLEFRKKAGAKK